ncbi:hypothetical protein SHXM_06129 [Streptomyces hygroscopicus]|nr:hypothetical protein SHXM_06129 [Streptomyces hygroscopicus]
MRVPLGAGSAGCAFRWVRVRVCGGCWGARSVVWWVAGVGPPVRRPGPHIYGAGARGRGVGRGLAPQICESVQDTTPATPPPPVSPAATRRWPSASVRLTFGPGGRVPGGCDPTPSRRLAATRRWHKGACLFRVRPGGRVSGGCDPASPAVSRLPAGGTRTPACSVFGPGAGCRVGATLPLPPSRGYPPVARGRLPVPCSARGPGAGWVRPRPSRRVAATRRWPPAPARFRSAWWRVVRRARAGARGW